MEEINTQIKKCCSCGVALSLANTKAYRLKNYIHKCNECINEEKKNYAANWRKENPTLQKYRSAKHNEKLKTESPVVYKCRQMCGSAKKRARLLGMNYDIDSSYLTSIAPEYCPVFGEKIDYQSSDKGKMSPSLDRIDSSKGYTKDNVHIISYLANLMKNSASPEEMIRFARWVDREYGPKSVGTLRTVEKLTGASK